MLKVKIFEGMIGESYSTSFLSYIGEEFAKWLKEMEDKIEIVNVSYSTCGINQVNFSNFLSQWTVLHNILILYRLKDYKEGNK